MVTPPAGVRPGLPPSAVEAGRSLGFVCPGPIGEGVGRCHSDRNLVWIARAAYAAGLSSDPPNPHDALFKAVFGEPEHARGALRDVLPAALSEELDWATLARFPGSFVDPGLREQHTDLLFSVAFRGGGEAFVYLLFEHQSTPDARMAYRILRYMVRIWERWSAQHAGAEALPAIVPVVLYHGAALWSAPRSFDALMDLPDQVRPSVEAHLVRFTYLLDDLSAVPDEALRARAAMTALSKLVALCFKHARTRPDLVEILADWTDVMRQVVGAANGLEALAWVIRYILSVNDHLQFEALQTLLERQVGHDAKETSMTVAEQLIQKGFQQGVQQGVEQGVQQGERNLLLRQLRQRFGDEVDAVAEQRIAAGSAEQIGTWAKRVLSAATLAEVLAD